MRRDISRTARAYGTMTRAIHHYRTIWDRLYTGRALEMTEAEMRQNADRMLKRCSEITALIYRLARVS